MMSAYFSVCLNKIVHLWIITSHFHIFCDWLNFKVTAVSKKKTESCLLDKFLSRLVPHFKKEKNYRPCHKLMV